MKPVLNNNIKLSIDKHVSIAAPIKIHNKFANVSNIVQSVSVFDGDAICKSFASFSDSSTQTSSRLARTLVAMQSSRQDHSHNFESVSAGQSGYLGIQLPVSTADNSYLDIASDSFVIISDNQAAMKHAIKDNVAACHFSSN